MIFEIVIFLNDCIPLIINPNIFVMHWIMVVPLVSVLCTLFLVLSPLMVWEVRYSDKKKELLVLSMVH